MKERRQTRPRAGREGESDAARRVRELEQQAEEYLNGWKRARADYANLERRMADERRAARAEGMRVVLARCVGTLDHFDRAFAALPPSIAGDPWVEGMRRVRKAFHDVLAAEGVRPINEARVPFDPTRHEAVARVASDVPENVVVDVAAKGYVWGETVLRAAKVRVSSGPRGGQG